MTDIEEAEDVTMTGNKIPVTTLMVTVMLLDKDCKEGEEDDATNKVMRQLWQENKAKDDDHNGKVEVEDSDGRVIKDEEDGG